MEEEATRGELLQLARTSKVGMELGGGFVSATQKKTKKINDLKGKSYCDESK